MVVIGLLEPYLNRGVGYIELRSLDVNPLIKDGIDEEQVQFLESFMLFCLLEDSPVYLLQRSMK